MNSLRDVFLLRAYRTPIGRFGGSLKAFSPVTLGNVVVSHALSGIDPAHIDEVICGQVLQSGCGMNVARQIALSSGLPETVPAFTVNKVCASGMKAVTLAASEIAAGMADLVVAGGVEAMSQAPFLMDGATRWGTKMGDVVLRDTIIADGLTDPTHRIHMALTVEALIKKYDISREEQDDFAFESQQRWKTAQEQHLYQNEIVPITLTDSSLTEDETPRPNTTREGLSKLRPVFSSEGSVTAGNASALADGAAVLLLASEEGAKKAGIDPIARITSWCSAALSPLDMGLGPVAATRKLLDRTKTKLDDYDIFEINEAFAGQVLACLRELPIQTHVLNIHGGAIALGHPLGCSGARIIVTMAHALQAHEYRRGIASLCVGGGMGMAVCLEHP